MPRFRSEILEDSVRSWWRRLVEAQSSPPCPLPRPELPDLPESPDPDPSSPGERPESPDPPPSADGLGPRQEGSLRCSGSRQWSLRWSVDGVGEPTAGEGSLPFSWGGDEAGRVIRSCGTGATGLDTPNGTAMRKTASIRAAGATRAAMPRAVFLAADISLR